VSDAAVKLNAPSALIRSMTGYALVRGDTSAGELAISLRSVNHRGLDLHLHIGGELAVFENAVRGLLKQHIGRGHVEVRISLNRNSTVTAGSYNRDLLSCYLAAFKQACTEFDLAGKPDLNKFLMLPGVLDSEAVPEPLNAAFEREIIDQLAVCIRQLNAYREREGRELREGLEPEIHAIVEAVKEIGQIRSEALPQLHQKLRQKMVELLGEAGISETRLAEEAALLAGRSDIQEELIRLAVHTEEVRRTFLASGEIGKRLDFILQEMSREANTILSKTSGIGEAGLTITNLAIGIKANIEKMREQVLNLE
jgi:uncharacterized protein (TIGR00255 family)